MLPNEHFFSARDLEEMLFTYGFEIGPLGKVTYSGTGCKSQFRKIFEFKDWKEPMLVLKQTIPQQKALDLSFNLAP